MTPGAQDIHLLQMAVCAYLLLMAAKFAILKKVVYLMLVHLASVV